MLQMQNDAKNAKIQRTRRMQICEKQNECKKGKISKKAKTAMNERDGKKFAKIARM